MRKFMNTPTVNPMHNELRRTIGALDEYMQRIVANNWGVFYSAFDGACQSYIGQRPGQGLYTTAAWAVAHACNRMRHLAQDIVTIQTFDKIEEITAAALEKCEDTDTRVHMFWYAHAERLGEMMPNCNNRILEDFQRAAAREAHQLYIHNPDTDIRFIALDAEVTAAAKVADAHPNNRDIALDMKHVAKFARETKEQMYSDMVLTAEPRGIVQGSPEELSMDELEEETL